MDYAPIALFVYNRADHTLQTLKALQANTLAGESELFIFSDAPKNNAAIAAVADVRKIIRSTSGFKAVHLEERESNHGLARSIITGVTELVERYGRVIVLEDDLVTSPFFLQYMNDALSRYENEDRVMHISGYMFPIPNNALRPTFFLRTASCWGWGTWKRAWMHFEKAPAKLEQAFDGPMIRRFNMDGTYDFWDQVVLNNAGQINTWAVFWYATIFQRNGLCLHPAESMVINIGNDGSGVHCGQTDAFGTKLADKPVVWFEPVPVENKLALRRTRSFFCSLRPSFAMRSLQYVKSLLMKVR